GVTIAAQDAFLPALGALAGPVRVDKGTAPLAVSRALEAAGVAVAWGDDPCRLPKARKTAAELDGMRSAHLRDGAAMCEFLAWLDSTCAAAAQGAKVTEIDVVRALEGFRRATNMLHDLSFETICGAGPNGAIMHYRVTEETNRRIEPGTLLLVDSGGQYPDGTTDITRTVPVGDPGDEARACYTRVLQGLVAISRLRWPRGVAGAHLDAIARYPLWLAGQDYDHGTGHGVGAFLSVHEGPQRLSRISQVPLDPGMILSNEPGYYRPGAFGIRLENLIAVIPAPDLPGADDRAMLAFETLTFAPFDRRLILRDALSAAERAWIDAYHAEVAARIGPRLTAATQAWLASACAPL
ncbi:MAG: M24 family metallopeptidase, partial [Gemmobacter sp.]